jgi:hypothetical protein
MQTQRICRAWANSFARGFARVVLESAKENLDLAPGSCNWVSELDADAEFNFFYPPSRPLAISREKAVLNDLLTDTPFPRLLA